MRPPPSAPSAQPRRPAPGAPSTSPRTSGSSTVSESTSPPRAGASACASGSASSTSSLTSSGGRAVARATAACGRTSSTYDALRPSRIWKPSSARWRDEIPFKLFGVLASSRPEVAGAPSLGGPIAPPGCGC
jgi:hypothetical protein